MLVPLFRLTAPLVAPASFFVGLVVLEGVAGVFDAAGEAVVQGGHGVLLSGFEGVRGLRG